MVQLAAGDFERHVNKKQRAETQSCCTQGSPGVVQNCVRDNDEIEVQRSAATRDSDERWQSERSQYLARRWNEIVKHAPRIGQDKVEAKVMALQESAKAKSFGLVVGGEQQCCNIGVMAPLVFELLGSCRSQSHRPEGGV